MTKQMSAGQIVEMHADLARRMTTDFIAWMWQSFVEAKALNYVSAATKVAIREASAFRVSDDMSTLIQFAASQLDESDEWDPDLAPTPAGLVRFDNPLIIQDMEGRQQKAHWILWGPISVTDGRATLTYMFNDHNDPDEVALEYLDDPSAHALGRWGSVQGGIAIEGFHLGPAQSITPAEAGAALRAGRTPFATTNGGRYLHAFWLMLAQQVTAVEPEHVRKTSYRLGAQAGITDPSVRLVSLRSGSAGARNSGESGVQWTHRWAVRGHWRWQAHGPGRGQRRRIWIEPFVKGPPDAPLVVTRKVYDVTRDRTGR